MPTYLYWGDDDFRLQRAVQTLVNQVIDPTWKGFNYDQADAAVSGTDSLVQALNQAMTPPFGSGDRLVWLVNPPLGGQESTVFREELERTLPALPNTAHLLLTYAGKPDGRSKITKFLQEHAQVKEFTLAPSWKTDAIRQTIEQMAQQHRVNLTKAAVDLLVDAVGNDTRQLVNELEKLSLYSAGSTGDRLAKPSATIDVDQVEALISTTQQSALVLSNTVRQGLTDPALGLVEELLNHNEPPLKISATLIRQFRTWLWIRIMQDAGERDDRVVAKAADIANPKRLYFLRQDVQSISQHQLKRCLGLLLDLEAALKQGQDPKATLQTKVIELCATCRGNSRV
jgi:DNA polymerase III subunit delta